jgi:hypothetical protein
MISLHAFSHVLIFGTSVLHNVEVLPAHPAKLDDVV